MIKIIFNVLANLKTEVQDGKVEHVGALHKEGIPFQFDSLLGAFLSKLEPYPELGVTAEETLEKEKIKLKTGLVGLVLPTGAVVTPLVNPAFTPEERELASVVRQGDVVTLRGKELETLPLIHLPGFTEQEVQADQALHEPESQHQLLPEDLGSHWMRQAAASEEFQALGPEAVRPSTAEQPLHEMPEIPRVSGEDKDIVVQGMSLVAPLNEEIAQMNELASPTWPEPTTIGTNFEFPRNLSLRLMAKARSSMQAAPSQPRFGVSQEEVLEPVPNGEVGGIGIHADSNANLVELVLEPDRETEQMVSTDQRVVSLQKPTITNQDGKLVSLVADVQTVAEPSMDEPILDAEGARGQAQARSQNHKVEVAFQPNAKGDVSQSQSQRKGLGPQPADMTFRPIVVTTPLSESIENPELEQGGRAALDLHDREAFFPKLVQNIQSFVQGERTEVRIQLKPDHLGELKIKLSLEQGIMKAEFVVENETVREVLASNLPQLHTALQDQGTQVAELMVNIGFGQKDQNEQGQARPRKLNHQVKQGFEESTTINGGNEAYLGRSRWNQVDVKA